MKKSILAILIILLSFSMSAQFLGGDASAEIQNGTILIDQYAYFSIGSGEACPPLEAINNTTINDTLFVELFYNLDGMYPMFGCCQYSQIMITSFDSTTCSLLVINNLISGLDTTFNADIDTVDFCATSVDESTQPSLDVDVFPNPAMNIITISFGFKFKGKLELFNLQRIKLNEYLINDSSFSINLKHLSKGNYILKFSNKEYVVVKKIIKM